MLRPTALCAPVTTLALGVALVGCSTTSSGAAKPAAARTAPSSAAGGSTLSIASFQYEPTPLTVSPGQSVRVSNSDSAKHTVSSDTAGLFIADDIAHVAMVTFTAPTKPGTYTFHCEYHASMHGTLVVR